MQSDSTIPEGYCQCGCGGKTNLAKETDSSKGWIKDRPLRYIYNHHKSRRYRPLHVLLNDLRKAYKVNTETGCWEWQNAKTVDGYGVTCYHSKNILAHRLFYKIYRGDIPSGLQIDHLCFNPSCCNPNHLEAVTPEENVKRSRRIYKLDFIMAEIIRSLYELNDFSLSKLGRAFSVSDSLIGHVVNNRIWVKASSTKL